MKKSFCWWGGRNLGLRILFLFAPASSFAQEMSSANFSGIYLTRKDFISSSISLAHEIDPINYLQIDLNGNIILIRNGRATKFRYGECFGYHYKGSKYRAYGVRWTWLTDIGYYRIEDEGTLIIYSKRGHHKSPSAIFYCYSRSADSPIFRLSIKNLKREYPDNPELVLRLKKHRSSLTKRKGSHLVINNIRASLKTLPFMASTRHPSPEEKGTRSF